MNFWTIKLFVNKVINRHGSRIASESSLVRSAKLTKVALRTKLFLLELRVYSFRYVIPIIDKPDPNKKIELFEVCWNKTLIDSSLTKAINAKF
jgi:hypothetical protein